MIITISRTFSLVSDNSVNIVRYDKVPGARKGVKIQIDRQGGLITRHIVMCNFCSDLVRHHSMLCNYVLPMKKLVDNAYPIESSSCPNMVNLKEKVQGFTKFWTDQVCMKCHQSYLEFNGTQLAQIPCRYHSGSKVVGKASYTCCGTSEGCCTSKIHTPLMESCPLVFEKTRSFDYNLTLVYALDTEMCITKNGLEVTKVTVVDSNSYVVYDSYVLPHDPIIDYNTKYSGVTAENLEGVTTTLEDVQSVLLSFIDTHTILIGHGLENDLKALKIIHMNVIDTSIIFPDPRGKSFKRSLKSLVAEHLGYDIQCSRNGHNSVEDAKACMNLVRAMNRNLRNAEMKRSEDLFKFPGQDCHMRRLVMAATFFPKLLPWPPSFRP